MNFKDCSAVERAFLLLKSHLNRTSNADATVRQSNPPSLISELSGKTEVISTMYVYFDSLPTLVYALVNSWTDYCNIVLARHLRE